MVLSIGVSCAWLRRKMNSLGTFASSFFCLSKILLFLLESGESYLCQGATVRRLSIRLFMFFNCTLGGGVLQINTAAQRAQRRHPLDWLLLDPLQLSLLLYLGIGHRMNSADVWNIRKLLKVLNRHFTERSQCSRTKRH